MGKAIRIYTGRRHQIRAHTRHVGHPTAADARYTPRDVELKLCDCGPGALAAARKIAAEVAPTRLPGLKVQNSTRERQAQSPFSRARSPLQRQVPHLRP